MAEATGALSMTKKELVDMIKQEAGNLLSADNSAMIVEQVQRGIADWERKSGSEQRRTMLDAKKAAAGRLFGRQKGVIEGMDQVMPTIQGKAAFTGESMASLLVQLANHGGSKEVALRAAKEAVDKGHGDPYIVKALEASTIQGGGVLVPIEYSSDFIAYLYNKTAVRMLGARTIDMGAGNLNIGKQNGTATAYWVGEGERITVSEQEYGALVLNAKKLGVLVPISNDLLRRAPAGLESMVRDDMVAVSSIAEDAAFLRSTGAGGTPKGIRHQMATGNVITGTSSPTLAQTISDLMKAMYKVESANVPQIEMGWAFNPRIKFFLMSLLTTDGYPVFMMEMAKGTLYGADFATTNGIPRNLNGGGDETEIYYGDFAQVIIGETANLQVDQSMHASYVDAGGNTVHGFQQDQSVMRLIHEVDIALRHSEAFSVIEGCDWGAALDA